MEATTYESIDDMQEEIASLRTKIAALTKAGEMMFDAWTIPDLRNMEYACRQWGEAMVLDGDDT